MVAEEKRGEAKKRFEGAKTQLGTREHPSRPFSSILGKFYT